MKALEIRELSDQELDKKIRDTEDELVQMRVRKQVGQVEHPHEIRVLRRNISRMKTIAGEKAKAAESA